MKKKTKILFVYPEMLIGGSTTSLLALLDELDKEKYDIDLALYENKGPMMDYIPRSIKVLEEICFQKSSNSRVKKICSLLVSGYLFKSILQNIRYKKNIGFSIQVLMDARVDLFSRSIDKEYDIAIGYLEGWAIKYVASSKVKARRKIGWVHLDYQKSPYIPELDNKDISSLDTVVSVSTECEKNNSVLFNLKDSRYMPNLLSSKLVNDRSKQIDKKDKDYQEWSHIQKIKIITVCRIENVHKGIDRAVLTAKMLKEKGIDFIWYILGDGSDREKNNQQIIQYGLQNCIHLIGSKINPYPFIKEADLFVLPSRYEGKPMVITEAMILGVPAIVTEYASSREQIDDGVNGIIVPNEDTALFTVMEEYVTNPDKIKKLKDGLGECVESNEEIKLYDELFSVY